ncbi:hypothetical protein RFI_23103 [Reticulomyxa filosa]|uniref:Importin alpha n=1 Tax=Reticulomyxa filosa TaxID=46433 RepID=X6MMF7_RETFI|nr:hypothetical protein RFI_23103 [Reticulomyxa filosa]|eukprot:ETO14265.1 hypothetical protein RFI_23103 [Reticulomyxa filosa]
MLKKLGPLLESPHATIRKEACWAVSNVTGTNEEQVQQVIDANLLPSLIHLLTSNDSAVRQEAAWALANITSRGTPEQIHLLVDRGAVKGLINVLRQATDARNTMAMLEAIQNICELGKAIKDIHGGVNLYSEFVEEAKGLRLVCFFCFIFFDDSGQNMFLEEMQAQELNSKIHDKVEELLYRYFEDDKLAQLHNDNDNDDNSNNANGNDNDNEMDEEVDLTGDLITGTQPTTLTNFEFFGDIDTKTKKEWKRDQFDYSYHLAFYLYNFLGFFMLLLSSFNVTRIMINVRRACFSKSQYIEREKKHIGREKEKHLLKFIVCLSFSSVFKLFYSFTALRQLLEQKLILCYYHFFQSNQIILCYFFVVHK